MSEYRQISSDIIENSSSYTSAEWDTALEQYKALREEYTLYKEELTLDEKKEINTINTKLNAALINSKIEDTKSSILSIIDEIKGTLINVLNN